METVNRLESEVRSYCRSFPKVFDRAKGAVLRDEEGGGYLDFLSGAGTLNYGHNNDEIKGAVLAYLEEDGILHGLDLATVAKRRFLQTFERLILKPRNLKYKVQFTGPTGTNAVEAALKIARNVKERTNIVSFTNGFHGMTLGSVSATGNSYYRDAAGVPLSLTTFMPYDGYLGDEVDTLEYLRKMLEDPSSGMDLPAAVIVETVQGEGGVNVASPRWLRGLQKICREFDILLIVDDIQVGCGRTGPFFSFEFADLDPDVVCLSKALSGYGLPMSVVLMKPELDIWKPGEHTGTFRGNNLAFVSAAKTLETYWSDDRFSKAVLAKSVVLKKRLKAIAEKYPEAVDVRGRGLIQGIECSPAEGAVAVSRAAFERGLIVETSGSENQVVKCLSALTIDEDSMETALEILERSFAAVFGDEAALAAEEAREAEGESPRDRIDALVRDLVGAYE